MHIWSIISSETTECHELFVSPGTRGVVLRPKEQTGYTAFVEKDRASNWSPSSFPNLVEAKTWCENELGEPTAPAAGYYIFLRFLEGDTADEFCFKRESPPFFRSADALESLKSRGLDPETSRLFLMLNQVPEQIFEPKDLSRGGLRFQFEKI